MFLLFDLASHLAAEWSKAHPVTVFSLGALSSAIALGIVTFFTARKDMPEGIAAGAGILVFAGTWIMAVRAFLEIRKGD